jgi:hypothetical protein
MTLILLQSTGGTRNGPTDYTWDLSGAQLVSPNNTFRISVREVEFPTSWYNVNSDNDGIAYSVNGGAVQIVNIPNQNYDALTLRTALETVLTNITVAYDEATNKFTFTHATSTNWSIGGSSFQLIGLDDTSQFNSVGAVVTPPNMVNLISKNWGRIRLIETNNDSYSLRLAKMQLYAAILQYSYYKEDNPIEVTIEGYSTLTSVRLRIFDPDAFGFDLNGIPFSLTLNIENTP